MSLKSYHIGQHNLIYLPTFRLVIKYTIKWNWFFKLSTNFRFEELTKEFDVSEILKFYQDGRLFQNQKIDVYLNKTIK